MVGTKNTPKADFIKKQDKGFVGNHLTAELKRAAEQLEEAKKSGNPAREKKCQENYDNLMGTLARMKNTRG